MPIRPASGELQKRSARARTRPRGIGSLPVCRCRGTGATFQNPIRPSPMTLWRRSSASPAPMASSATATPAAPRSSRGWARRMSALAGRSVTPRSTACSRSPPMRKASASIVCLRFARGLAPMLHARRVGRVIARPFVGEPGNYTRTVNRRDYAIAPPEPTLLDWVQAAGRKTYGIGKIRDIFAGQGVGQYVKGGRCRPDGASRRPREKRRGRKPDLRQFRRVRQSLRPPPERVGLRAAPRMVRRRHRSRAGRAGA